MEVDSIKTISCELKDLILKQLADGRNHDVNDIKAFVQEKSGLVYETDYTKSHLAGSLFQLVNKNKIQKVERGVYRILGEVPAPEKEEDPKEGFLKEGFGTGFFECFSKGLGCGGANSTGTPGGAGSAEQTVLPGCGKGTSGYFSR